MTRQTAKPFLTGLTVIFLGTFVVTFFNLYDTFPYIDKLFHVIGGFIVAWFFSVLWGDNLKGLNKFQRVIVFMAMASFVGVFWEIMEYSTSFSFFDDQQLIRHYLYGGNMGDTLGDLMADIFGAVILGFLKR